MLQLAVVHPPQRVVQVVVADLVGRVVGSLAKVVQFRLLVEHAQEVVRLGDRRCRLQCPEFDGQKVGRVDANKLDRLAFVARLTVLCALD